MAPHSSTLAWKIPQTEEPGRLQSMGSRRVRHDWATSLHFLLSYIGEGNGNPLQCSCLENPRDRGAWRAAVYGVARSRTKLKQLSSSSSSRLRHTRSKVLLELRGERSVPRRGWGYRTPDFADVSFWTVGIQDLAGRWRRGGREEWESLGDKGFPTSWAPCDIYTVIEAQWNQICVTRGRDWRPGWEWGPRGMTTWVPLDSW